MKRHISEYMYIIVLYIYVHKINRIYALKHWNDNTEILREGELRTTVRRKIAKDYKWAHTHTHKKNKLERKTSYAGVKAKDRYCYGDVIMKICCPISCWLSCLVILVSQTACNFLPQSWKERLKESVEQTAGSQSCTGWKQFDRPTTVSLFLKIDTNTNALESDVFSLSNLFFYLRLYCVNRVTGFFEILFHAHASVTIIFLDNITWPGKIKLQNKGVYLEECN